MVLIHKIFYLFGFENFHHPANEQASQSDHIISNEKSDPVKTEETVESLIFNNVYILVFNIVSRINFLTIYIPDRYE